MKYRNKSKKKVVELLPAVMLASMAGGAVSGSSAGALTAMKSLGGDTVSRSTANREPVFVQSSVHGFTLHGGRVIFEVDKISVRGGAGGGVVMADYALIKL